jgi:hypothetical protein
MPSTELHHSELHHRIAIAAHCYFSSVSHCHRWSSLLFIGFTFRTELHHPELHHRIAIAAHCYFSSVSHFAPNYGHRSFSSSHYRRWSSLLFIGFTFRTELHHRIAKFHRFHISHRTTSSHCKISSVSHFAPNYIIALQNANLDEMSDGNVNAVSGQFDE